ncbi:hypothetical protein C8R46DRAFT_1278205 [Mycena filopes]|nr:hypothetical protein C8R46DRAFT_1278205 [Mycena filopes]
MARGYCGCNACLQPIAATDPRIHCLECEEYDLCANCAISERFSADHAASHPTCIFQMSGGGAQLSVLGSTTISYVSSEPLVRSSPPVFTTPNPIPSPPIPQNASSSSTSLGSPRQRFSLPPPPPLRQGTPSQRASVAYSTTPPATAFEYPMPPAGEPSVSLSRAVSMGAQSSGSASVGGMQSPVPMEAAAITSIGEVTSYTMPPRGDYSRPQTAAPKLPATPPPPPPPPTAWGPFFNQDMTPTPVFMQFMDSIFTYLDTQRTNTLTPEVYSRFLINQGYVGQQNIWNSNLVAAFGQTKEEVADAALKRAYDLFNIQHTLRPRIREPTSPPPGQLKSFGAYFARAVAPTPAAGAMTPLLTRTGFAAITAIEALCDPARHHGGLAHLVKLYDLPEGRAWGALPRGVLPAEPDARMLARVAGARQAQQAAQRKSSYRMPSIDARDAAGAVGLVVQGAVQGAVFAKNQIQRIDAQDAVNAINLANNVAFIASVANSDN